MRGKRKDATPAKDLDTMHKFMPYLLGGRTANEAVMVESVDLSAVNRYIEQKNSEAPDFKYTLFHVISAAIAKTVYHRPLTNRFIMGGRYYDRNQISLAFVVKKAFCDKGAEALAICRIKDNSSPLEQIRTQIYKIVHAVRKENKTDGATDIMDALTALPPFIIRLAVRFLKFLDKHGKLPMSIINEDPYHCTVFISNLGSIKLHAGYHHLTDWGTNSFFVIIGEKYKKIHINEDNSTDVREYLDLAITVDERIADGYYFAQTVKILRAVLENPQLLEETIDMPINDMGVRIKGKEDTNARAKSPMA